MKTIRSLTTLVGLSLVIFALGSTGARAQAIGTTQFAGTVTLPFQTQWGEMTLPAGDYTLIYGDQVGGPSLVAVRGRAKGHPQGMALAIPAHPSSATKNSLICIRDGNTLVVRKLEMPAIGQTITFAMPHGTKLVAHRQKHGKYMLAEAPMLIQRVPVTLNAK